LLAPIAWIYGNVASLRRTYWARRATGLDRPVLSVGNITCGGTGKTPVVEMLVKDLLRLGRHPAVLSRGYGAATAAGGAHKSAVNDEYLVLAANVPGLLHLQGADRVARGRDAIGQGADVLVLDDGFQHVRLRRDLDFVLIDALQPFSHGRVLPSGLLREPLEALAQADLFGITRSDQVEARTLSTLSSYLRSRFRGIPQVELVASPIEWATLGGGAALPEALTGRTALAFCGIGNPESFRRQLESLRVTLRAFVGFRDHHRYTAADIRGLLERALELGVDEVVMTQKDAVKMPITGPTASWRFLRIEARVARGREAYEASLARALEGGRSGAS